jgi:hypothetical protein
MVIKPWYVKKTAESFVRQKIRSPCGRENRSKPAVLSLLEISPLSRFCSYYGDRSEVSEAALEEKDPWRRGGTPRAPVRSLSSVRPSFPRLRPRAVGWISEELRPWRLAQRRQSGSCPSPRRRVLLRVPDSFFKTAVGWPSVGSGIQPRRRTSEVAGGYHMPFPRDRDSEIIAFAGLSAFSTMIDISFVCARAAGSGRRVVAGARPEGQPGRLLRPPGTNRDTCGGPLHGEDLQPAMAGSCLRVRSR